MVLITVPTTANGNIEDMPNLSNEPKFATANSALKNSAEGVSLKNVFSPTEPKNLLKIEQILANDFQPPKDYHWYFLRVNYGRAEKLYNQLKDRNDGYLLWMPCEKHVRFEDSKKLTSYEPMFKSNLFAYGTYNQIFALTHRCEETGFPYVDFAYDHTKQNAYGRDSVIEIPFLDMRNFAKAVEIHHPWAHVVSEEKLHFRPGGKVRVTGGPFEGVEGYVARVFGQTRVVVTIKGIVNYATAYVSQKYLHPIDEYIEEANKKPEAGNSVRNRVIRHELRIGARTPADGKPNKHRK